MYCSEGIEGPIYHKPLPDPKLQLATSPKNYVVDWLYGKHGCRVWTGKRFSSTLSEEKLLSKLDATLIKRKMKSLGFTCVFLSERIIL